MNTYSDILDRLDGKRAAIGEKKMAHLNFPLSECEIGKSYTYKITFMVSGMSMDGCDLEIINLSGNPGEDDREDNLKKMKVFPSPS